MNSLKNSVSQFALEDSGAITVDWVVLTAGLVGLGIATTAVVSGGAAEQSAAIDTQLSSDMISTSFEDADPLANWERQQWDAHNPGIYDSYSTWMAGFSDENLLAHYNNTAQWADYPANSGHPYDTYHDEHYIARDELIARGLLDPSTL